MAANSAVVVKLADQLEKAQNRLKKIKSESAIVAERSMNAGLTVLGGIAVGAARSKWGDGSRGEVNIPGTEIDADAALGTFLIGAGVMGFGGRQSEALTALGSGMLAAYGAFEAKRMLDARK